MHFKLYEDCVKETNHATSRGGDARSSTARTGDLFFLPADRVRRHSPIDLAARIGAAANHPMSFVYNERQHVTGGPVLVHFDDVAARGEL
jgi:hypothetical protein